ncbi:hypothetical protein PMI18_05648, partial [Pseudomonas sp. GM102]
MQLLMDEHCRVARGKHSICRSEACPRRMRRGFSGITRHRSSR